MGIGKVNKGRDLKVKMAAPALRGAESYKLSHPEVFRPVGNVDNIYYISNWGRVTKEDGSEVALQGEGRYAYVKSGGRMVKALVSYMVARAFVNNTCLRPYVVHKDGDVRNNTAGNLEWSETGEKKAIAQRAVSKKKGVVQYTKDGETVGTWDSVAQAAAESGVDKRAIYFALKGERETAGGYLWRYGL